MNSFQSLIEEYIDRSDIYTMKFLQDLNEADASNLAMSLTTKLYEHITKRITDVNFESIPNSKGDITKIDNYDKLMDCLEVISQILKDNKEDDTIVQNIIKAEKYMRDRLFKFELGFKNNSEFVTMIYCTTTLAIITSTSYMIASSIEYFKNKDDKFDVSVNKAGMKRTMESVLYKNILKFNNMVENGQLDKTLSIALDSKNLTGSSILSAIIIAGIALAIIPFLKEMVYFFYYCRVKLSDYIEVQANLLELNAYKLKTNSSLNPDETKKVKERQLKVASTMKNISGAIQVKVSKSNDKTLNDIKTDKVKFKIDKDTNKLSKPSEKEVSSSPLF